MSTPQDQEEVQGRVLRNRVVPTTTPTKGPAKGQRATPSREPSVDPNIPSTTVVKLGTPPVLSPVSTEPNSEVHGRQTSQQLEGDSVSSANPKVYVLQDNHPDNVGGVSGTAEMRAKVIEEEPKGGGASLEPGREMDLTNVNNIIQQQQGPVGGQGLPPPEKVLETLQSPDFQIRFIVATVRESIKAMIANDPTPLIETSSKRAIPTSSRVPPMFNGEGAKNWLLQIENYHELLDMPVSDRVADAVSYLSGRALTEYALEKERGRHPRNWGEFRQWVSSRFHTQTELETVRRLLALEWDGSLDRLCDRFTSILADGSAPPNYELVRLFVRALPPDLVVLLGNKPFQSWVEVRNYLLEPIARCRAEAPAVFSGSANGQALEADGW